MRAALGRRVPARVVVGHDEAELGSDPRLDGGEAERQEPKLPAEARQRDLNVGGINLWTMEFASKAIKEYLESIKEYPNPPAPNLTRFSGH